MFECGERAEAVAIHLAMCAVVETEDVARTKSGAVGAISQASLRMVGDRLQTRNQPFRRFLLPIPGKQRPHDRAVAEFAGRRNNPRISHPKRRAKPLWRRVQDTRNRVVAQSQFNADFPASEPEKIRMCFGVIANKVSTRDGFSNQLRTFAHVSPNQEKCRLRIITAEKIKQFWRDRGIWSVVEGKSQLARGVCPANGRPKKLGPRIDRSVGGKTCSSDSHCGRRFDEPGIHAHILARAAFQL